VGFVTFQSVVCAGPVGSLVSHPRLALTVSGGAGGSAPVAVPRSLARPGSSSPRLSSPSESSVSSRSSASRPRNTSLGVGGSLFATSTGWHRHGGFPGPPPSVLGVSHALDGLIRHQPRGFVSPHSHVQGSPFRGFPSPHSRTSSSLAVALPSVGRGSLPMSPPAPGSVAPPSGRCSVRGVRCRCDGVTRRTDPLPSWVSSSSRCSLSPPPGAPSRLRPPLALCGRPSSRPPA